MSGLKILHTADLHLDSPFEGLPEAKAVQRRAEQRKLLERIAQTASDEGVQLVLLSGDLLDSDSAYMETAEELIKSLGSVAVPCFIAPGNHDFCSSRSPYARLKWPENVHIFRHDRIECVPLPELKARVWGAGFNDTRCSALLDGFEAEKEEGVLDLMCIHGEVGARDSVYDPISEDDIARSGMDYVALGHIHSESGLRRAGDAYYAWPGCPEGRGFDETGDKFVYVVELCEGKCSVKPVNIAMRKYETIKIDISDSVDIMSKLPDDTAKDIYRIILTGETDEAPNIAVVKAAIADRFFALQIRDDTRLRRDIWEKTGEDTLRGLFLKKLRGVYETAGTDEEKSLAVQAVRWGLAAMDNREEVRSLEDK